MINKLNHKTERTPGKVEKAKLFAPWRGWSGSYSVHLPEDSLTAFEQVQLAEHGTLDE